MVNLLSRGARPEPFPPLDDQAWDELVSRLERCAALSRSGGRSSFEAHLDSLSSELDELESAPSLVSASSLLEAVDQYRRERLEELSSVSASATEPARDSVWAGSLICYFPGRSMSTGEAEVASRGYFDVLDRPPLWSWLAVVGRPVGGARAGFEVGILAWVALEDERRARAGCEMSAAPAVMSIEAISEAIALQWGRRRA